MKQINKNHVPFGYHLMVDAYKCDKRILTDANSLYRFLDQMPIKLGMRKMIKPYLVSTEGNNKHDPGGWSGVVLIEESHVSVHTFVRRQFATIDVYSCKEFNANIAIDYIKDLFATDDLEIYKEIRGKKYPAENID